MNNQIVPGTQNDFLKILHPQEIRRTAQRIFALAESGATGFALHLERLEQVARLVADVTRGNYPDLRLPPHARWRHFQVGGIDRVAQLDHELGALDRLERARAKIDLVVVSVLLDAGAGERWRYLERRSGREFQRSEGLALASLDMFLAGNFAVAAAQRLRVDASALRQLDEETLAIGMQVSAQNPLTGLNGRLRLLHGLADALSRSLDYFPTARPGALLDHILQTHPNRQIRARDVLNLIQRGLGQIWPGRLELAGQNLGDVWRYPPLGQGVDGLVPFHKLSQWLCYSLLEPLTEAGVEVTGIAELTGLPEYRNGGLFLDGGVLRLREASERDQEFAPGSERIVEWRALTIHLLDLTLPLVRRELGLSEDAFALPQLLEGGTWAAGRLLAKQRDPLGSSPLKVLSDGTVF